MASEEPVVQIATDLDFSLDFDVREEALAQLQEKLAAAPVDARAALAAFAPSGDEFQRLVVEATDQTIRLVAPAGSGKTQTVVHRVLAHIKTGVNPKRILVLTFDTAAASSIRGKHAEELLRLGAESRVIGTSASTLNAFGYQILRDHFPDEYKNIAEDRRRFGLLRLVKKELQTKSPVRCALPPRSQPSVSVSASTSWPQYWLACRRRLRNTEEGAAAAVFSVRHR